MNKYIESSAYKEAAITVPGAISSGQTVQNQPRAQGAVNLSVCASDRGTRLKDLRQSGALKLLFPRTGTPDLQSVLINTAGGITGGDSFHIQADAEAETQLTLTTQTAERAYRAQPDQTGHLQTQLSIGQGARLDWLPQETILFQGCALQRSLHIDMAADATLLMAEPLVFGRQAMGEVLSEASFADRIEIRRNGTLTYLDALRFQGNVAAHLARPNIAAGAGAMATVVYVADDAAAYLAPIRALTADTGGASLVHDDLLVLRLLAADSYLLRKTLIPILTLLRNAALPRCWMI